MRIRKNPDSSITCYYANWLKFFKCEVNSFPMSVTRPHWAAHSVNRQTAVTLVLSIDSLFFFSETISISGRQNCLPSHLFLASAINWHSTVIKNNFLSRKVKKQITHRILFESTFQVPSQKLRKATVELRQVRLPAQNNSAPAGRIFIYLIFQDFLGGGGICRENSSFIKIWQE